MNKFTSAEIAKEQQEVFDNMYSEEDILKGDTIQMMMDAREQAISNLTDRQIDRQLEDDAIEAAIEELTGTCKSFSDVFDSLLEQGISEDKINEELDNSIVCCEQCGWWVEICEVDDDNVCEDCNGQ